MSFQVKMVGDFTLKEEIDGLFLDWKNFKKEFIYTGKNIHRFMIEYLKANVKGTSNDSGKHLHNEIDFEFLDEGMRVSVGIGDIEKLNTNAPWWRLQNFGLAHPMAGRFVPGGFSGRKFIYDPGSKTGIKIKEGLKYEPINYIENAEHYGTAEYQRLIQLSTTK